VADQSECYPQEFDIEHRNEWAGEKGTYSAWRFELGGQTYGGALFASLGHPSSVFQEEFLFENMLDSYEAVVAVKKEENND